MKESLLLELDLILDSLKKNETQSIEIRGAVFYGEQFKSALSVVSEDQFPIKEELKLEEQQKEEQLITIKK